MDAVFVKTRVAAAIIGLDPDTLKTWRENELLEKTPCLRRGIHFVKPSPTLTLYNRELLIDFIANIETPEHHERAIECFLAGLPSSQTPVRIAHRNAA
jgi:hypothetical protein